MGTERSELQRLKWVAILGPLLFLVILELARNIWAPGVLGAWPGYLLIAGIVLIGTLFFSEAIFGVFGRLQLRLERQNMELLALHDAGLAITGELDLDTVLQNVVDLARDLGPARYGALSLLRDSGSIEAFYTSGISDEQRDLIGPIPERHGLLFAVTDEYRSMHIPNIEADPRSVGFPPHHPPMTSLLAVPIHSRGRILGSLYLADKEGAPEFSDDDRDRLERFATQAAIAIENAHLHRQVRAMAITEERERIAREMHDTVAQVLGYVSTKAQAAQEFLRQSETERAQEQIAQLSGVARDAYSDVRENILSLRTSVDRGRSLLESLQDYVGHWQVQSGVDVDLVVTPPGLEHLDLPAIAELQLVRIIQESLTNVRKHAGASNVRIELSQGEDDIQATITDDGTGFEPMAGTARDFPRFGLATMRERAETVGGTLDIQSAPGEGTTVVARLPRAGRNGRT